MATTNLDLSNYNLIFSQKCAIDCDFNFLDIVDELHIVCLVINGLVQIILKHDLTEEKSFYHVIYDELLSKESSKPFFFLKNDERTLSKLSKKYDLQILKDWFCSIEKKIDLVSQIPYDDNLIQTAKLELDAFYVTKYKTSKQFYFIQLLLQRLEKKIHFSTNIAIKYNKPSIEKILSQTDFSLCFYHIFPSSEQTFVEIPKLHTILKEKLFSKGIDKIYMYQSDAIKAILENKSIVITAPTGNGKTESFLLPVLQKLLEWKKQGETGIKIVLFYPTKALASDQLTKINFFISGLPIKAVQLDSDTNQQSRYNIYSDLSYNILITTPDLIHYSLHKKEFQDFIDGIKVIIFDEIHTYTGTFGTHLYYFLKRLERIVKMPASIQYIAASATIANPVEFTSKLFNREMIQIRCTTPKRNFTELYCIQRKNSITKVEATFQLVMILIQMINDEKILIFRNSQQEAEQTFEKLKLIKNKKVALHRAGFTKDLRTQIEKQLRDNEIDIVVTTTTLEVGIDIGSLTTVISPIVPVNRLLQRFGRAGRGSKPAKIFLELEHDPISYYYSSHASSYLNDISPVNINTENESIANLHLLLMKKEKFILEQENTNELLFSLRNVNEKIEVKSDNGYKVTEKELPQGFYDFYPFKHFLYNGQHYGTVRVEKAENNSLRAIVTELKEKFDYKSRTKPIIEKKVFTDPESRKIAFLDNIEVKLADCKIQLEYQGCIFNYKEQVLTDTYTYEYKSKCVIFNFEDKMEEYVKQERIKGVEIGSIVHTLSHVLYKACKMIVHCENDLINFENSIGMWKVIFVDNAINGNGLSELVFERKNEIWSRARDILKGCQCIKIEGCIICTMDYYCPMYNKYLLKRIE